MRPARSDDEVSVPPPYFETSPEVDVAGFGTGHFDLLCPGLSQDWLTVKTSIRQTHASWMDFWNRQCDANVRGDHGGIPEATRVLLGLKVSGLSLMTLMRLHPVCPAGAELLNFQEAVSPQALAFNSVLTMASASINFYPEI